MKWISVEDESPKLETSVLLLVNGCVTQGYLFEDCEFNEMSMENAYYLGFQNEFTDDVLEYIDVTHWMPLPEPPALENTNAN